MELSPEIVDSIELRFSNLAREMNRGGKPIISMGLGEPDFPTPPPIVEAAAKAMRDGFTRYSNPFGLYELRERISDKLSQENGIVAGPDNIIVTPGAKMALSLTLAALLRPGDEIVNITPCYPSFVPQIKIAEPNAQVRNVDLARDGFRLDRAAVERAMSAKTKALLINFPHNPTGAMLSAEDVQWLVDLLAAFPACHLVADEVYEKLTFGEADHVSPGARPEIADRTVTINGFSKAYSMTGWRIGYLVAPSALIRPISRLQQHMNTNTATFIQKAAYAAFDCDDGHIEAYNGRLKANAETLRTEVERTNAGLRLVPSQGGLFAFLNITGTGLRSDPFSSQLLEAEQVAATPGIVFGANWDDHIRISLATNSDDFNEGVQRLVRFAATLVSA